MFYKFYAIFLCFPPKLHMSITARSQNKVSSAQIKWKIGLWAVALVTLQAISEVEICLPIYTGGKPRNYHKIMLTQYHSHATSETHWGSANVIKKMNKGWCHFYFCFIFARWKNDWECDSIGPKFYLKSNMLSSNLSTPTEH